MLFSLFLFLLVLYYAGEWYQLVLHNKANQNVTEEREVGILWA